MPELSVVMRSGSIDPWLGQAVESVLASQDVDLEIILVLNGPKITLDSSLIQAEEEANPWLQDARVRVLRYDHYLGTSGSMAEGVSQAHSEFIANVDGDDIVLPQKFALQLDYLRQHPDCVLVGTRAQKIDENGTITGDIKGPVGEDVRPNFLLFNPVPHSSIVFRRTASQAIGSYRRWLDQYEDYDFMLRLASKGKIAVLDENLVLYRVHSTNISKGAQARGSHIAAVTQGRRALARTLGISPLVAWPQHALWRTVQFVRDAGLIRPLHEYSKKKS